MEETEVGLPKRGPDDVWVILRCDPSLAQAAPSLRCQTSKDR